MNQTVINSVYPKLVPLIAKANGVTTTPIGEHGRLYSVAYR